MGRIRDLSGQIFGRLTVIEYGGPDKHSNATWICLCSCGTQKQVVSRELTSGGTKSCGCLKRELTAERNTTHGLPKYPLFKIWYNMMGRCYNPQSTGYKDYGGRGITVCDEWCTDPNAFVAWGQASGYEPGLTIERKEVNGNYEPGNCEWADRTVQNRNTRRVKLNLEKVREIRADNRFHREIAEEYGIDASHVSDIKSHKVWKED